ncbi:MAG: cadherin-like domain-containing protein [Planctomycetaceae bacterium]
MTYTVTSNVNNGTLKLNGSAIGLNDTFTQQDIDDNLLTYDHNGGETTSDAFDFSLADGGENGSTPATGTFSFTVTPVNDAPVLTNGSSIGYGEGSGAIPFTLSSLSDADSADFNGGILTLTIASAPDTTDTLTLANFAGVSTSGSNVLVSGITVGTMSGGSGGTPLVVTFNANATVPRVQSVYQALAINNLTDNPVGGARSLEVTVTDGDGSTSNTATATATLTPVNDAPVVTAPAGPLNATEQIWMNFEGAGFSVSDVDAAGGTLTATLTANQGAVSVVAGDSGVVIVSGNGTGTVQITGTESQLNSLFGGTSTGTLQYRHPSNSPPTSTTLTLTINDQGNTGTDPGLTGDGTSEEDSATVTINITATNDIPLVNMSTGGETYVENASPVIVDSAVTITDSDNLDFDGGVLTVSLDLNGTVNDRLTVLHEGTGAGQIEVAGSTILVDGVQIATFTGGVGVGDDLLITFDSDAFAADVENVARRVAFSNTSEDPSAAIRVVGMLATDGDGGSSLSDQRIVYITAVNDEEVLATNAGATVFEGSTNNVIIAAMLETTDVDNTASEIVYTVDSVPIRGTLRLNGTALIATNNFTQADINSGLLTYDHDGSEATSDQIDFTVDDGQGSTTSLAFVLTVTGVNDAPVLDLNGGDGAGIDFSVPFTEGGGAVNDRYGCDINRCRQRDLSGAEYQSDRLHGRGQ